MIEAYQALVSADNMPELGALAGTLTADLRGLYQDAEVSLNWREIGEMPVPLPMADVFLKDDGFGGPVDRQGHGLQRAFIFPLPQHPARRSDARRVGQEWSISCRSWWVWARLKDTETCRIYQSKYI